MFSGMNDAQKRAAEGRAAEVRAATGASVAAGAFRTTRKPSPALRVPGGLSLRFATRQKRALAYQPPPRSTRDAPKAGPAGSVTGPAG